MLRKRLETGTVVFGLLILAAGVLLMAFNTGWLPAEYRQVVFSWPTLLVTIGVLFLFSRGLWGKGLFLIFLGGFFILIKLNIEGMEWVISNGWAFGLILCGILVIGSAISGRRRCHRIIMSATRTAAKQKLHGLEDELHTTHHRRKRKYAHGYIDYNCVFSGVHEKLDMKDFRGGDVNSVFGGVELDLTDVQMADGTHRLELNSVFGGIVLFVPTDWNIEIKQNSFFGQFVDKRSKTGFAVDEKSLLIIEASNVFGGGEIRCR